MPYKKLRAYGDHQRIINRIRVVRRLPVIPSETLHDNSGATKDAAKRRKGRAFPGLVLLSALLLKAMRTKSPRAKVKSSFLSLSIARPRASKRNRSLLPGTQAVLAVTGAVEADKKAFSMVKPAVWRKLDLSWSSIFFESRLARRSVCCTLMAIRS